MNNEDVLKKYKEIMPFLSELLGPGCEIVLHDVTNKKKSIIAISNPLSGRKVGDPLTDLAEKILQQGLLSDSNYIANYSGKSKGVDFLSSTFLIKNEGKPIGMLCVNKDVEYVHDMYANFLQLLKKYNIYTPEDIPFTENLDNSTESYIRRSINQAIKISGLAPERMTVPEKKEILASLKASGVLELRGAIKEVASSLYVSVPTIYRYLKS